MTPPRNPLIQRCPHCDETLEYTKNPPRFCSRCGGPLRPHAHDATQPYTPPTTAPHAAAEPAPPPERGGGYRLLANWARAAGVQTRKARTPPPAAGTASRR